MKVKLTRAKTLWRAVGRYLDDASREWEWTGYKGYAHFISPDGAWWLETPITAETKEVPNG